MDADSAHFAHAFEDLAEEARQQAAGIAGTQPGISLGRRIREELETFGLGQRPDAAKLAGLAGLATLAALAGLAATIRTVAGSAPAINAK